MAKEMLAENQMEKSLTVNIHEITIRQTSALDFPRPRVDKAEPIM